MDAPCPAGTGVSDKSWGILKKAEYLQSHTENGPLWGEKGHNQYHHHQPNSPPSDKLGSGHALIQKLKS